MQTENKVQSNVLGKLMMFLGAAGEWAPMNLIGARSYGRPVPRRVTGKKAWKMRGKRPGK